MILCFLPIIRISDINFVFPMQEESRASRKWDPLVGRAKDDIKLWNAWLPRSRCLQGGSDGRRIRRAEDVKSGAISD